MPDASTDALPSIGAVGASLLSRQVAHALLVGMTPKRVRVGGKKESPAENRAVSSLVLRLGNCVLTHHQNRHHLLHSRRHHPRHRWLQYPAHHRQTRPPQTHHHQSHWTWSRQCHL